MYTTEEIAAIQRHTLRVLVAGQIAGSAALAAAVTVGAFVVQDILGQSTPWGGVATATVTMGTAFMSQVLARLMNVRGRRAGLQAGYSMAIAGGLIAGLGVELGTLWVFLPGLFLFGNGQAANLLSRYAATDLAHPDQRGRAMSRILFASTFGAVFGPLLIRPAQALGESLFDWKQYTGPWIFAGLFFLTSFVNASLRLRPDPLEVAGGLNHQRSTNEQSNRLLDALRIARGIPDARLALFAMVIAQSCMVAVMTMTPVHLKSHGHETVSSFVISLHIAGMFAFSPLVGRFSDKYGRYATILAGSLILMTSTIMSAMSGDDAVLLFPALWLLGIGWSFGLIGGSSLLVDSIPGEYRVKVQGSAGLLMSFFGGLSGFASGFIRKAIGYHMLSNVATLLSGVLVVFVVMAMATPRRSAAAA